MATPGLVCILAAGIILSPSARPEDPATSNSDERLSAILDDLQTAVYAYYEWRAGEAGEPLYRDAPTVDRQRAVSTALVHLRNRMRRAGLPALPPGRSPRSYLRIATEAIRERLEERGYIVLRGRSSVGSGGEVASITIAHATKMGRFQCDLYGAACDFPLVELGEHRIRPFQDWLNRNRRNSNQHLASQAPAFVTGETIYIDVASLSEMAARTNRRERYAALAAAVESGVLDLNTPIENRLVNLGGYLRLRSLAPFQDLGTTERETRIVEVMLRNLSTHEAVHLLDGVSGAMVHASESDRGDIEETAEERAMLGEVLFGEPLFGLSELAYKAAAARNDSIDSPLVRTRVGARLFREIVGGLRLGEIARMSAEEIRTLGEKVMDRRMRDGSWSSIRGRVDRARDPGEAAGALGEDPE